jgi:V8-like Glu-specific endopeptidase
MSKQQLVERAKAVLLHATARNELAGLESAATVEASRAAVDQLFEQARAHAGLNGAACGLDRARIGLASAYLEQGRTALKSVAEQREADLTDAQLIGLEAIVRLTGRPSFLVQHDAVSGVPEDSQWAEPIAVSGEYVRENLRKVGRINLPEVEGQYLGTGFVVANDLVMTNRHVAMFFAQPRSTGWTIGDGFSPSIDFKSEHALSDTAAFRVTDIALIHPDPRVDLALLKVATSSDSGNLRLPAPLKLASDAEVVAAKRPIYVIGYPAFDPRNNASAVTQVFGSIFHVKRFAPGDVMKTDNRRLQFLHDCSTLGGNSGSCVVDFSHHVVFGLHYGGNYLVANRAVSMPMMRNDKHFEGKGLNF